MYKAKNIDTDKALKYLGEMRKYAEEKCAVEVNEKIAYKNGMIEGLWIAEKMFCCSNYEKEDKANKGGADNG